VDVTGFVNEAADFAGRLGDVDQQHVPATGNVLLGHEAVSSCPWGRPAEIGCGPALVCSGGEGGGGGARILPWFLPPGPNGARPPRTAADGATVDNAATQRRSDPGGWKEPGPDWNPHPIGLPQAARAGSAGDDRGDGGVERPPEQPP